MEQSQLRCQLPHVGTEVQKRAVIHVMEARRGLFRRSYAGFWVTRSIRRRYEPAFR